MQIKYNESKIYNLLLDYPKTCLLLSFLLVAPLAPHLFKLKLYFGPKAWFPKESAEMVNLVDFERKFGNDEGMVIAVYDKSTIYNPQTFKAIKDITNDFWQQENIIRVDSLANFNHIFSQEDDILIEPLIGDDDQITEEYVEKKKSIIKNHEDLPGFLVSPQGTTTLIFATLRPYFDEVPNLDKIKKGASKVIAKYKKSHPNLQFYILGQVSLLSSLKEIAFNDTNLLIPLISFFIAALFFYLFKNVWGLIIPLLIVLFTNLTTLGIGGLLQVHFTGISFIIPIILMAISIADAVHMLDTFFKKYEQGQPKKEALKNTLLKNFLPTFLTSLTTAIGFFCLMTADLIPLKHLGLITGIGVMFAWVYSQTLLIPILLIFPVGKVKRNTTWKPSPEFVNKYIDFIKSYKVHIITTFILFTIALTYLGSTNEINSNPYKNFSPHIGIRVANEFMLKEFGGLTGPQIILDSKSAEGVNSYEFLSKVEMFQDWLVGQDYINSASSILNVLKQMNRALNGGGDDQYILAKNKKSIAEQIFLYTLSVPEGKNLNHLLSLNQQFIRMSLLWTVQDSVDGVKKMHQMEQKAKELGLSAHITGKVALTQRMVSHVISVFLKSFGLSLTVIVIILFLVFRSLKIGLLSIIPNIVPIALASGILTIWGVTIDFTIAIVSSVCLGIAVDDTIHFLTHYQRLEKEGVSERDSFLEIFQKTGPSLIITSFILMAGFGSFVFSNFLPNRNFGILCAIVLGLALLTDLILLPALVIKKK
ncbi:MAG: MMPL family transporter [Bacteriovoracaceae bacterium]|nr:MMPL family transporter [Bacteriovoracaceae bacterium]